MYKLGRHDLALRSSNHTHHSVGQQHTLLMGLWEDWRRPCAQEISGKYKMGPGHRKGENPGESVLNTWGAGWWSRCWAQGFLNPCQPRWRAEDPAVTSTSRPRVSGAGVHSYGYVPRPGYPSSSSYDAVDGLWAPGDWSSPFQASGSSLAGRLVHD